MAKQITFDNVSISSGNFRVSKITDENVDSIEINMFDLARQRGGFLLNKEYKPKKIMVKGSIQGTTMANLESNIDELKELLNRQSKNLDIVYSDGTRRFLATCSNLKIDRDFYHLTYTPYEADFIVPMGIGTDITTTSSITTGITSLIRVDSFSPAGTVTPKVTTTISITSETNVTELSLLANGDKITITTGFNAGDIIIIDENTLKVTINGVEVDYVGIFPRFIVGVNAYSLTFTGTDINYDLKFEYIKTYL